LLKKIKKGSGYSFSQKIGTQKTSCKGTLQESLRKKVNKTL
jgi:hypothetical protein